MNLNRSSLTAAISRSILLELWGLLVVIGSLRLLVLITAKIRRSHWRSRWLTRIDWRNLVAILLRLSIHLLVLRIIVAHRRLALIFALIYGHVVIVS